MIEYTSTLLFTEDREWIALIQKNFPLWQAGLLNGPGGHVEDNEQPIVGAVRKYEEETGVRLDPWTLKPLAVLECQAEYRLTDPPLYRLFFYYQVTPLANLVKNKTSEKVYLCRVDKLRDDACVKPIPMLIRLALDETLIKPVFIQVNQRGWHGDTRR